MKRFLAWTTTILILAGISIAVYQIIDHNTKYPVSITVNSCIKEPADEDTWDYYVVGYDQSHIRYAVNVSKDEYETWNTKIGQKMMNYGTSEDIKRWQDPASGKISTLTPYYIFLLAIFFTLLFVFTSVDVLDLLLGRGHTDEDFIVE